MLDLGADLANMVNAAAIYAASEGDTNVTTRHLEFAKDKILMGKYFCQCFFWLALQSLLCVQCTLRFSEDFSTGYCFKKIARKTQS